MKSQLPIKQLSESQWRPFKLNIESNTKIVQAHFRCQARLKTGEIMWPFPVLAKRVEQFVIDTFNDLSQAREPAAQGFGPVSPLTLWVRSGND